MKVFIDGDFDSKQGDCEHHCSPSCHPCQIGPEWVYGCRHMAWPANKYGDFVPIVGCGGNKIECDIPKRLMSNYKRGISTKLKNAKKKVEILSAEIDSISKLNVK